MNFWTSEDVIYMEIPSKSNEGKNKILRIDDFEARCILVEEMEEVTGFTDTDNYVDCPACLYGKYCGSARKVMDVLGLVY